MRTHETVYVLTAPIDSPLIRSGAMYDWQPMLVLLRLSESPRGCTAHASDRSSWPETPKSHSLTRPAVLTSTFDGLMSRC